MKITIDLEEISELISIIIQFFINLFLVIGGFIIITRYETLDLIIVRYIYVSIFMALCWLIYNAMSFNKKERERGTR